MNKDIAIKVENLSKVYRLYNAPIDLLLALQRPLQSGCNYDKFNDSIMLYFAMRLNLSEKPLSLLSNKLNLFYAISSVYSIITTAQVADASVYKQTSVAFFLPIGN